jgi:hypothetical protein
VKLSDRYPERVWINQPSTLQPDHDIHGVNVLAIQDGNDPNYARAYFLSGPTESRRVFTACLAKGWKVER